MIFSWIPNMFAFRQSNIALENILMNFPGNGSQMFGKLVCLVLFFIHDKQQYRCIQLYIYYVNTRYLLFMRLFITIYLLIYIFIHTSIKHISTFNKKVCFMLSLIDLPQWSLHINIWSTTPIIHLQLYTSAQGFGNLHSGYLT